MAAAVRIHESGRLPARHISESSAIDVVTTADKLHRIVDDSLRHIDASILGRAQRHHMKDGDGNIGVEGTWSISPAAYFCSQGGNDGV